MMHIQYGEPNFIVIVIVTTINMCFYDAPTVWCRTQLSPSSLMTCCPA